MILIEHDLASFPTTRIIKESGFAVILYPLRPERIFVLTIQNFKRCVKRQHPTAKLEKECKNKIYNKYFKDTNDIEESILSAIKKQILGLTYIYV